MEIFREDNFEKAHVGDGSISGSEPEVDGFKPIVCGSGCMVKEEELKPEWNLSQPDVDGFEPIVFGSLLIGDKLGGTENVEDEEIKIEGKLSQSDVNGFKPIVHGSTLVGDALGCTVKVEEAELNTEEKPSLSIEEELGKVSLVGGLESESSSSKESESKSSSLSGTSSSEESESESSSSASSSCSSSDDKEEEEQEQEEENKEKVKVEIKREVDGADVLEEGEIGSIDGEMTVAGTDDDEKEDEAEDILGAYGIEFDEIDDEESDAGRGPIKSKNELEVLPPVPPVDVTLQPHHQMLPVGCVLSILGTKVIVEGREQHNPLNEGSILWITTDRSPLGLVDEIFGPVKNPYYVVRYNSESEVPAGIHEGSLISFVPEFANHVLNDPNLHKKGYDASGENDEELLDDAEFSDDEKEAEYKRMQKMEKRGMNDQTVGKQKRNKKKVKSRNGAWKNNRNSAQETSTAVGQLAPNQNQHNFPLVSASLDNHNCSSSAIGEQKFVGGSGFLPPFSVMPQSSGIISPSNGVWTNGVLVQQRQQNAIFPNMFSAGGTALLSQNFQQPIPLPTPALSMPTLTPYLQQHFDPSLSTLPNTVLPVGQTNLFAGPACAPWLGIAGQNGFSETTFGMGMQGQRQLSPLQGILMANGPMADGNCKLQPNSVEGNFEISQNNFSRGASSSHRKKPFHKARGRGGGRGHGRRHSTGGRGHQQP